MAAVVIVLGLPVAALTVARHAQPQPQALAPTRVQDTSQEVTLTPPVEAPAGAPASAAQAPAHDAQAALAPPVPTATREAVASTPAPELIGPWQGTERLNILLLGIDQRPGEDADKSNTDTMIVVSVDPSTHSVGMLSVPRDLYVTLPNHTQGRINTAQAIGGPAYAEQTVSSLLGIPIEHYVRVNFSAVTKLVDLVGGIDVYVDQDINDPTYPNMDYGYDPFVISKGWHHMDGATALKYARTRHQSSDFVRMKRQQQIILALRDRVLSSGQFPELLLRAPSIFSALHDSVVTDLDFTEVVQLMLFARDLPQQNIAHVTVDESAARPWTTPGGAAVLLPDAARLHQLVQQLLQPPVAAGDVGRKPAQLH